MSIVLNQFRGAVAGDRVASFYELSVPTHLGRFQRQPDNQWLLSEEAGMASSLSLNSLECRIPLSEIYEKVDLAESPTA